MRSSTILALSAFSLALSSTAAWADGAAPGPMGETPKPPAQPVSMGETPKPPAPAASSAKGVLTLEKQIVVGRAPRPHVSIDINRLVQRSPLPELRQPLVERIGAAVEKDPF